MNRFWDKLETITLHFPYVRRLAQCFTVTTTIGSLLMLTRKYSCNVTKIFMLVLELLCIIYMRFFYWSFLTFHFFRRSRYINSEILLHDLHMSFDDFLGHFYDSKIWNDKFKNLGCRVSGQCLIHSWWSVKNVQLNIICHFSVPFQSSKHMKSCLHSLDAFYNVALLYKNKVLGKKLNRVRE